MLVQEREKRNDYESPRVDENGERKGKYVQIQVEKVLRRLPEVVLP